MIGRQISTWPAALSLLLAVSGTVAAQGLDPLNGDRVPRLEVSELTRIGGYDERPAYSFSLISAGAVLSEEEVALVDRHSGEIRVFDVDGLHLRTFGREGEGPGEFRFLRALHPLPDNRLVGWDFQAKRVSVFASDGELRHTSSVAISGTMFLWADFVGAFPDGSFVLRMDPNEMALRNEPTGYRTEPTSFVHYSARGEQLETLCVVAGPEKYLYHEGRYWGLEDRLLEREVVGAVVGDTLHCGWTESLDLLRVTSRGDSLPSLSQIRPKVAVTTAEVESIRRREAGRIVEAQARRTRALSGAPFAPPDRSAARLERLAKKEAYATRPAFRSLLAGVDGALWVEDYGSPDDTAVQWVRFDETGVSARLEVPAQQTVLAIGRTTLLMRSEDEWGVQTVMVMRITEPEA